MTYCHIEPNGCGMREVCMCVEVVLTLDEEPWEREQQERREQSWGDHSDGWLQIPLSDPPVPTLYPTVPADPPLPAACNTSSYCSGSHVSIVNMQKRIKFPPAWLTTPQTLFRKPSDILWHPNNASDTLTCWSRNMISTPSYGVSSHSALPCTCFS